MGWEFPEALGGLQMEFSDVELPQGQTLAEAAIQPVRVQIFGLGVMVWQGALVKVLGVKKAMDALILQVYIACVGLHMSA